MDSHKTFTCYIIGQNALTLECAEILLQAGHRIQGIVSTHVRIQDWAKLHQIPFFETVDILEEVLPDFDYLFSIVNFTILSPKILSKPRFLAINFHDALLPQYAGSHATSWSILKQEKKHGITWHVMKEKIDTGEILKQKEFPITPNDTAHTLNLKCYEQAIKSFKVLVEELENHSYQKTVQNLQLRSYHDRYQKPIANGLVDWNASAEVISCLVRALQFDIQPNILATPKFMLAGKIYIIKELQVTEMLSQQKAGSIVSFTSEYLQVSTGTRDIRVTHLSHFDGQPCSLFDLSKQFESSLSTHLSVNLLESIDSSSRVIFKEKSKFFSKRELYWVKQLIQTQPVFLPYVPLEIPGDTINKTLCAEINIPNHLRSAIEQCYQGYNIQDVFLAIFLVYCYRVSDQTLCTIGFKEKALTEQVGMLTEFFSTCVPYTIEINDTFSFQDVLSGVVCHRLEIEQKGPYLKDIPARYPECAGISSPPIAIEYSETISPLEKSIESLLHFVIPSQGEKIAIYVANSVMNASLSQLLNTLSGCFLTLLNAVINDPLQKIAYLPILTQEEQQKVLVEYSTRERSFPSHKTIHQLFEEQVLRTPDKIAVSFADKTLTYKQLDNYANQLAAHLKKMGIQKESRVILCTERSLSMVALLYGVLKAGGVYVPIETHYPLKRMKDIIEDAAPFAIITQSAVLNEKLINQDWLDTTSVLLLEELEQNVFHEAETEKLKVEVDSHDLAYIIYTSGSTGKPKGVLVPHQGVVNCVLAIEHEVKVTSRDIFLAITSLTFDVSALDYYLPLSIGAKTVIADNKDLRDVKKIISLIELNAVTALQATPSTCEMFRALDWQAKCPIKLLICGEALLPALAQYLLKNGPVFNIYGPTEATIYTTLWQVKPGAAVTIGCPIDNLETYVLDKNLQPLPIGYAGELFIGGVGVARGYLNRPELTAERFIQNPFSSDATARLYKTGDSVRWLSNGELEYLGRLDNQVKVRSFRIELGEIEHALLGHPNIAQAVVLAHRLSVGHQQLIAFIVPKNQTANEPISVSELQSFLQEILPHYMMPASYITLPSFPLNASAKVDRKLLATHVHKVISSATDSHSMSPATSLEQKLIAIWENILKIAPIRIDDNFFSLGGDSILVIHLISKIERECGLSLSVENFYKAPAIVELLKFLSPKNEKPAAKTVPMTPLQAWFFEQNFSKPAEWSQTVFLEVKEPLNIDLLKQALELVLTEYDAFQLVYKESKAKWQQTYSERKEPLIIFEQAVLFREPAAERTDDLLMEWGQKVLSRFNLTEGPLVGLVVFKNKLKISNQFLLAIHPLLIDMVSWRIFLERLATVYDSFLKHRSISKNELVVSYEKWAIALDKIAISPAIMVEQEYWLKTIGRTAPLPSDKKVIKKPLLASNTITFQLDVETTHVLAGPIHALYQTDINDVLLTALLKTFTDWTKSNTLVFDLQRHLRQDKLVALKSSNTIGCLSGLSPVCLTLTNNEWNKLLLSVKEQLSEIPYQGFNFGILKYLSPNEELQQALAKYKSKISFNYWGQFGQSLNGLFKWEGIRSLTSSNNHLTHLINIDCLIKDNKLIVIWTYDAEHFHDSTIQNLGNNYQTALTEIMDDCLQHFKKTTKSSVLQINPGDSLLEIKDIYPLTPLQQGLLFQKWRDSHSDCYEIQASWQINHALDPALLKQAWEKVIQRHEILRTEIAWENLDEPVQVVKDSIKLPYFFYDWQHLDSNQKEKKLSEFLLRDQENKIDLNKTPLFWVIVIRLSLERYMMVLHSHHILLDGWSFSILLTELSHYYQGYLSRTRVELPPPAPFSDYVVWLSRQNWSKAKEFWQGYLKDFSHPTPLMITDNEESSHHSITNSKALFETKEIVFSIEESQTIRKFVQSQAITLNTFFQGLWGLLLYRYTQLNDIVIGVTDSGRLNSDLEMSQRVGLFINTLPLRISFSTDLTAREFLPTLQKEFTSLLPFSHTPLPIIHNCCKIEDSKGVLFDSIIVFENYPKPEIDQPTQIVFENSQFWSPTHYALTFIIIPDQQIKLQIGYDARRVSEQATVFLLQHLEKLYSAMIQNPDTPLIELDMLSAREQDSLVSWQGKNSDALNKTFIESLEEWSYKKPNKPAIHFDQESLTYDELNRKANQIAFYLREKGIQVGDPIGLCLSRSLESVVSLIGIWKAGGVYVPLMATYPVERLKKMISISQIKTVLISQNIFEEKFSKIDPLLETHFYFLEAIQSELPKYRDENPSLASKNHDLAYILYTSGSTGQPKAVLQEHKTITNLIKWQSSVCSTDLSQKITQIASIGFDVSLQEICYALGGGHELYIVSDTTKQSLAVLLDFLEENEISQTFLPTALLEPFCEAALLSKPTLSGLTEIFVSGEALKISHTIKEFFSKQTKVRLTNQYGPTETHVASAYQLPSDPNLWPAIPPIGKPIDNTRLYILNEKLKLLPLGVAGELYIAGAGVAREYKGDIEHLSGRFLRDPFSQEPNALLYRTGDRVKWRADGELEYLNRIDQQVKIRGYRVELEEIEITILKEPGIRQCAVIAEPDHRGILQLVCYLVMELDSNDTMPLQKSLQSKLPGYMIPTYFIPMKAFPLTPNGKLDKNEMTKYKPQVITKNTYRAPRNLHDNLVIKIVKQTLNVKYCCIDDDFFELGGDSLSVLRLLLAIEREFNIKLTVSDFLLTPTIKKISDKIKQLQASYILDKKEAIHYAGRLLPFPIVALNTQGDKPPLFLIHPVGGTIFWFVALARYLGNDRAVYGIQDPSILYSSILFNTVEEMAAFYLYCMRKIQPKGPYLMAGASFGATIAFEITKQLENSGEKVIFTGILDGWSFYPKELENKEVFVRIMCQQTEDLYKDLQVNKLEDPKRWYDLQWHRYEMLWKYRLTRLNSKLTLFKAKELAAEITFVEHPYNHWNDYSIQPIEVHLVPGSHSSMFKEPNVQVLAEKLRKCLIRAENTVIERETALAVV